MGCSPAPELAPVERAVTIAVEPVEQRAGGLLGLGEVHGAVVVGVEPAPPGWRAFAPTPACRCR